MLMSGYMLVYVHHLLLIQYELKSKEMKRNLIILMLFIYRPRFVILGQIGNTGLYKNIDFFPSVSLRFLYIYLFILLDIGTSISKNKNSAF
jgi:hypothetical protein